MARIVKSPQFDRDISEIWGWIAKDNEPAADRVVLTIESKIELLAQFPGLGTLCPHLAVGLRRTLWKDYLIYYRISADAVELVRVLHAHRNIKPEHFGS